MTLPHLTRSDQVTALSWIGGSIHHIILDGDATGGRLSALRSTMVGGAASPLHVHERDDETVFLLSGEAIVWAGPEKWTAGPGDTVFLPLGVPHTYLFTSERAEVLTICNPAGMEDFFRAAGWDLSRPQPADWAVDLDALAEAARSTGQTILGPPLGMDDVMPQQHL